MPWLALHRAGGEAADNAPLEHERERDQRQRRNRRRGGKLAPRNRVLAGKQRDADRQRLERRRGQYDEREEELVPRVGEHQDRRGEDAGRRERQDDFSERLGARAAVDQRGLFDLVRQLFEKRAEDPDRERQRERDVRDDDAGVAVEPAERVENAPDRSGDGDLREHRHAEQNEQIPSEPRRMKARRSEEHTSEL